MSPLAANDLTLVPGLPELWAQTLGDPRVCVAVLDGPVDRTHPAFAEARLTEVSLDDAVRQAADNADHGTHVASILFAGHETGLRGVAPRCRGLVIPIFEADDDGALRSCSQERLALAIHLAVANGADVINISGGQLTPTGDARPVLADAVQRASEQAVVVAAAGNDGCACLHVPGALPGVVAVGAMNALGEPLPSSNWGAAYEQQGILALGENIPCAGRSGTVQFRSGTSFATAIVSGVVALLLSRARQAGRTLSPQEVRRRLLETAERFEWPPLSPTSGVRTTEVAGTERRSNLLAGRLSIPALLSVLPLLDEQPMTAPTTTSPTFRRSPAEPASRHGSVGIQASAEPTVAPAGCGCGGGNVVRDLAYVIGQVGFEYESDARHDSVQQAMERPISIPHTPSGTNAVDVLRHLLGYEEVEMKVLTGKIASIAAQPGTGLLKVTVTGDSVDPVAAPNAKFDQVAFSGIIENRTENGVVVKTLSDLNSPDAMPLIRRLKANEFELIEGRQPTGVTYDTTEARWYLPAGRLRSYKHPPHPRAAAALSWTVNRGSNLLYVVRPQDTFATVDYADLARFLLSHLGLSLAGLNIYYFGSPPMLWPFVWNPEFNGTRPFNLSQLEYAPRLTSRDIQTERVALPGVVTGTSMLRTGTSAPLLVPEMRGASEWSRKRLTELLLSMIASPNEAGLAKLRAKIAELLDRLDEETRNPGRSAADRALNFASTQHGQWLGLVKNELKGAFEIDDVFEPRPGEHCRAGSDCWDVEVALFNPSDVRATQVVVRQSIDVSDVVPVVTDPPRRYRRREA